MRKLFLLIPALVLSLITNAATVLVSPGNNTIRAAIGASTTADGDVLVLADGTYTDDNYIELTKSVEIVAADGASPIIELNTYIKVYGGKHVVLDGLNFDGNAQGSRDQYFRFTDSGENELVIKNCTFTAVKKNIFRCESGNKFALLDVKNCQFIGSLKNVCYLESSTCGTMSFDGCEFSGTAERVIHIPSTAFANECIINNCYFHNNIKSCICLENTTATNLTVANSTFAENTTPSSNGIVDTKTTGKVTVDHCTFYNCPVSSTDYGAVKIASGATATVSNNIIAMPSATGSIRAIHMPDGFEVKNCLVFNYTNDGGQGIRSGNIKTNCLFVDPLFDDLANNKYSYSGNWVTMELSPARGAATDGSDLGDPRWYTAPVLPSTDLSSTYDLLGTKALLTGNIGLNGNDHIAYNGASEPGVATWKLHIERACSIGAIADRESGSTSGCTLTLTIYDADGNALPAISAPRSDDDNDINFSGSIYIPEAGDYTIKLTNAVQWSSAILEKITLSYLGGAVIPVSPSANTTLNIADALFSGCTRDADYIQFPSSGTSSAWIKWNISTSETAFYDITLNIDALNAHGLTVEVFENEAEPAVASVSEGSYVETTGILALALGRINLVGGKNYIVKVTNAPSGSIAKITSLIFAPVVSSTINLPDVLPFNQAVLSTNAHVTDSKLYFAPIGDTNPEGEWAQWAVATDHDGLFLFTMNVNSDNGQSYRISILDDGENLIDSYEHKPSSGAQTITHYFALSAGNYFVKVENTTAWSHGYLVSFEVTEPANAFTISETATDNSAWVSKVNDENPYDVQIIRTLKAGMYNTFCLPFAVGSSMCKAVFGNDVEIYTLGEATVEGEVLNVTLNNSSDIYQGTPVFIKPSTDIVNPIFTGVNFKRTDPAATTKTNANFVGTFVSTTLTANTDILYLGPDNTLYYPEVDTPIKGFRAWFTIHDAPSPAPAIRRMNIVRSPNEATAINLINETKKEGKRIENGQLIIIRDGIRYNAMGIMIK